MRLEMNWQIQLVQIQALDRNCGLEVRAVREMLGSILFTELVLSGHHERQGDRLNVVLKRQSNHHNS